MREGWGGLGSRSWFNIDEYDYPGERISCEVDDVRLVQPVGFVWFQKPRYRIPAISRRYGDE